jgi:hypothetical protein
MQSVDPTAQIQDTSSMCKPNPLSQKGTMYFNTCHECTCLEDKFDITGILMRLDLLHLGLGFCQYEERLKALTIQFLETANLLSTGFYMSDKVGMTEEAAGFFRQFVTTESNKALLAHEQHKMRVCHIANDIHTGLCAIL